MDNSNNELNNLTLKYFTSPNKLKMLNEKKMINDTYNQDFIFYKKRILMLTNDLFNNKDISLEINDSFKAYTNEIIKYFKFLDKKDIIQSKYKTQVNKLKNMDKTKKYDTNIIDNNLLKKDKTKTIKTLDNFVNKKNKMKIKPNYPKVMEYNINDKKHMIKGIKF